LKPKVLIVRGGIRDSSRYNYRLHEGFFEQAFGLLGYDVIHYGNVAKNTKNGIYHDYENVQDVVKKARPAFCFGVELDDPIYLRQIRGVPRVAYVCDIHRLKDVSMLAGVQLLIVRSSRFEAWVRKLRSGDKIKHVCWLPFSVDMAAVDRVPEPAEREAKVILVGGHRNEPWPVRHQSMVALMKADLLSKRSTSIVGERRFGDKYFETVKSCVLGLACTTRWRLEPAKHIEFPACGTALMTDGSPGVEKLFPSHLYIKYGVDSAVDVVRSIVTNPARLAEIRVMARESSEWVRSHHTNEIRARELGEMLVAAGIR
jgi:hypothetical protein